ncbi:MAG TPA: amino acid adenylation domain-containing protein [Longimicrobiaceae bacterium]|nr:amino acid adenylation domain-containing protein [Longimicrobiaceae bacterium]
MTELHDRLTALSPAKRALLEKLRVAAGPEPIPRIAGDSPAPLSAEQRRLWFLLQLAPGYPIYTIPLAFRLRGPLDGEALLGALRDLVQRHESLRTAFRESAGIPVQVVHDGAGFAPEVLDLRGNEWAEPEAAYQTDAFARRVLDYGHGETFRALLIREGEEEHRLLLALHHLAGDGWSAGVLLRDLSALYAARARGEPARLPALPVRYRDWAAWQQRPERPAPTADEAYWVERLAGAPRVLEVPPDLPRPPVQGWGGAKVAFELAGARAEALRALARREEATPFAVLAAALALVLRRYAGQDDLLLGTLLANRPRPELEPVVGFFANTLPLRLRLDGDPTVGELVRRAQAAVVGAQEHAELPFDRIVELAGARRDFSRPALVQALLTVADAPALALRLPGVATEPLAQDSSVSIFELTLQADDRGDDFTCAFQYPTDLYEPATARRMARHLEQALDGFAAGPDRRISRVGLATDDEVREIEGRHRSTRTPGDGLCVHELFEWQARATPHAAALVWGGEVVSYAELDRRANRMAHALRARGMGPESRVAVCLERTPALVAALLGVLKAGAAYVPLDPAQPPARHAAVLRGAGARLVVADGAAAGRLGALVPGVAAVEVGALDGGRDDAPDGGATPWNLAYVIFTSGSTGGPRGVEIEHRSAAAVLAWMRVLVSEDDRSAVLASTAVTFDVSVAEIFGTLAWGGTLVLVENALAELPGRPAVRSAAMVPTAAAELLRAGRFPPAVATVLLGGEPVPFSLVGELHALPGVRRVLNLYGPSEDTTYTSWAELEPGAPRVTVGRPIAGGRVYVLDEGLRHAGIGVAGEVWTAGAGVARGYASRPALTAERFVPDPFGLPGARMYRTLDRGRWRDDGTLEYLGRADAQVKVRGYRIELEEVEQALAAHPAVAEAAVAVRGEPGGADRHLAAFLVARGGAERPAAADLRAFVRERLPEYMVPGSFGWLDALPRTTSGKLDRRALPERDAGEADDRVPYVAPRNELEERLAGLWREVLEVERVGVYDDFFDLGGQSIAALRLLARVRDELGVAVPVAELLTGPTPEALARFITGRESAARLPLVPLQTFGERPPLFLVHPAGGHVVCYRDLAYLLASDQPVYALQPRGIDDGEAPIAGLEAMAAHYVEAVRAFWPEGPYRVGGWSFGGVVAWEMARQLDAAGLEVDLLALFDTAPHTPEGMTINAGDPAEIVWQTVAGLAGHAAAARVDVDELRELTGREQALAMLRKMDLPALFPESNVDLVLALTAVRAANLQAQAAYRPRPYRGRLTYFRTAGSDDERGESPGLEFWGALAEGGATAHRVPGSHGTILQDPFVHELARVILATGAGASGS